MCVFNVLARLVPIVLCLLCVAPTAAIDKTTKEYIVRLQKQSMRQRQVTFNVAQTNGLPSKCIPAPPPTNQFGHNGLAWDGRHLWVASDSEDSAGRGIIYQIDPEDGRIVTSFPTPGSFALDLTFDGQYLWNINISDDNEQRLYQIDRNDGSVIRSIPSPSDNSVILSGLTWDGRTLWVTQWSSSQPQDDVIHQIDPANGAVLNSFSAPYHEASLSKLAWDGANLWFVSAFNNGLFKLDPDDGEVFVSVPSEFLRGLTFDETILWAITVSDPPEICQVTVDTSPGQSVTILPPAGKLILSQQFDLVLFVKAEDASVLRITTTLVVHFVSSL